MTSVIDAQHGLQTDKEPTAAVQVSTAEQGSIPNDMQFSFFFFGNSPEGENSQDRYALLLECARYADQNEFAAVWCPERHFHAFGGLSPNPSVLGSAMALATENVQIRSGSVVLPLHHPVRVVEEWSVVDNLSHGRVGLGVASGWFPNDFVLSVDNYHRRKEILFERMHTIRQLWRGEKVTLENPLGDLVDVQTIPRPVQKELPLWITAAVNPDTFRQAGETGTNVLTHLLGQSLEELAAKIRIYREAWRQAGHPGRGIVSLMLHTFVGDCAEVVRETVRHPMKKYLGSSVHLVKDYVGSLPLFKNKVDVDIGNLSPAEVDQVLDYSFERYFRSSGLFGTPQSCLEMVRRAKHADVDDIACLIDFGVLSKKVISNLKYLNELRQLAKSDSALDESPQSSLSIKKSKPSEDSSNAPADRLADPPNAQGLVAEIEGVIREVWEESLQLNGIGTNDNFFDLGGHSLLAARVHGEIQKRLDVRIPITDLFRYPTVHALALHLAVPETAKEIGDDSPSGSSTDRARSRRHRRVTRTRQHRNEHHSGSDEE